MPQDECMVVNLIMDYKFSLPLSARLTVLESLRFYCIWIYPGKATSMQHNPPKTSIRAERPKSTVQDGSS